MLSPVKTRTTTSVNVYLILKKRDGILLHLRQNTGYLDGFYGFVAGHVEDGESATDAMIREAKEEAGITISSSDLHVVHVLHRKTNRFNIDIFFSCDSYIGTITNKEPHKCADLNFFPLNALPDNTIEYTIQILDAISKGSIYSEIGWRE